MRVLEGAPREPTLRVMDPVQLALSALLGGLAIGSGLTWLIIAVQRAAQRAADENDARVPDGVVQVLEALEGAAAALDPSLTVVASSDAGAAFGMRRGEVIAAGELRQLARAARRTGNAQTTRFRMRAAGGAPPVSDGRLVAARASVLGGQHVLLVVDDVSEQERLEQMRYDFVANTSHELKTPVGAVSLLSEAIAEASDDPEQVRSFAARLQAEASRLTRLTARIMDLSRLQSADQLRTPELVTVDEIVATAVEAHQVEADSAGVELLRGGDRGLVVMGDPMLLIDAVGNLLANAIAYSSRGSRVGIGVRAEGELVEIAVTDRGIGIAEHDQQRIFERFYRSDAARSRRTGGTGLGLAIVKHVAQRHGGEVRVWSRPGSGSTFTLRLPAAEAAQRDERRAARKSRGGKALPGRKKGNRIR